MRAGSGRFLEAYIEANRLIQLTRPEMPVTIVNTFLAIVLEENDTAPPCLLELSKKLGIPASSMSRHVRYLSDWERVGKPGCGWVIIDIHPHDNRQRVAKLSRKGRLMADQIRRVLTIVRSVSNSA